MGQYGNAAAMATQLYGIQGPTVNGRYAIEACEALRSDPTLVANNKVAWDKIKQPHPANENCQLDVVMPMWSKGLLH